jgi:hypothetical protein
MSAALLSWSRAPISASPQHEKSPAPKPKPSKTKKDSGGDGRREDLSRCGSNFTYARAALAEGEVL